MVLNERLTSVLLVLKIIFWCVLIYTAVIGAMFMKNSSEIVQTRLERGEPPFRLDSILAAVQSGNKDAALPTLLSTQIGSSIKDPAIAATVASVQMAASNGDSATVLRELTNLDGLLAAKGLNEARTTNQQLLKAVQSGDQTNVQTLTKKLLTQLA